MPLVSDPDMTPEEVSQYRLYQIRVFEKALSQLERYSPSGSEPNPKRHIKLLQMLTAYGSALNEVDCFELERELVKQEIFADIRVF